ncbi:MAG: isoleucine--tRNA ligase [Bacteroidales bacterium]|nr:isoleucine--tRNA ligase [Bacteroidales bacterium]
MKRKFPEYKEFDLAKINIEILEKWNKENTFKKSLEKNKNQSTFIFYEGPPSANGMPGIHHVISRTIKDIICRYKTLQGYHVERKAGWDTHGLPVELSVEKSLGITKEDIGNKISIEEYNNTCRKEVMKYTREWEDLTEKMGYWVDMDHPYITYDNRYIETLWYLLKELYKKGLLYKGYSIQPYSPAAGTGLSTHELNQPGAYKDVKDTTCVAQFKVIRDTTSEFLFKNADTDIYFLAWTTTPWTLPSNTALAIGANIKYCLVRTFNPYTGKPVIVILAKDLFPVYFSKNNELLSIEDYTGDDKNIPYKILSEYTGKKLEGIHYEQLLNWVKPEKEAFRVLLGDFVTIEEGTGIVHIAPTFGADDYRVAQQNDIPPLIVLDKNQQTGPLVDKKGRFVRIDDLDEEFVKKYVNTKTYYDFAGKYVKNSYDPKMDENDPTIDVEIAVHLKKENKAFRIEKHVHNYPHCWRTDKPVLYYPMDSWFIKTTALKDRMMELNKTINWKPESTGTGRFGKWLENLVDWNLSRSRYWGTPLPIWISEDKKEQMCIGSVAELKAEIDKSVKAGFMKDNPLAEYVEGDNSDTNYKHFDLHRPFVDDIILVSGTGKKMLRETDLIDVWFDSGAMPYAQVHYPFSVSEDEFNKVFPADFIAEGVDQTRGWFFTLHAIASMLFDSVAFKNIISNGLILDKSGNKMSKRLGNAVDPFKTIEQFGSDPLRWYMITNAQPWDNLKFDIEGVDEVKRKFFGTLYNTYSFFALYANIDGFDNSQEKIPVKERPEIDRWIISLLNSLIREVEEHYEDYELTKAGRAIQYFVIEHLSNWYVRLNRKRYWGGEFTKDKLSAYQTLYTCIETVARLSSPIAPFYMDKLSRDLNITASESSVHLGSFTKYDPAVIDHDLEERMELAQQISSMILGLRRKVNIKVRQPLQKMIVPLLNDSIESKIEKVKSLILSEVNVKEIEYLKDTSGILVKKIKPNFKLLGPKFGKLMKEISQQINTLSQEEISSFESQGTIEIFAGGENLQLSLEDVEITSEDIPGWLVANQGKLTVAIDITISEELQQEGIARELVNRIQNLRKDSGFEVTDKISIEIEKHEKINEAVEKFAEYIQSQTLAFRIQAVNKLERNEAHKVELDDEVHTLIKINKI